LENKEQLRILEKLIDEADAKPPSKYSSDILSEIKMGKKNLLKRVSLTEYQMVSLRDLLEADYDVDKILSKFIGIYVFDKIFHRQDFAGTEPGCQRIRNFR